MTDEQARKNIVNILVNNKLPEKDKRPYWIICTKSYEFEGREFKKGELSQHSFGRNIPKNWRKATHDELNHML